MRTVRLWALGALAPFVVNVPTLAQPVLTGATVLVRLECTRQLPCHRFVARAESVGPDSLTLAPRAADAVRVAWPEVVDLSVSVGRYRPVLRGAAIGLGVGLLVGGVLNYKCEQADEWLCATGVIVGAGGGVALGTLTGFAWRLHRWRAIEDWPGRRTER